MQSINFEGQILIENAWAVRVINREKSISLIQQSINYFLLEQIEKQKEKIIPNYYFGSEYKTGKQCYFL